MIQRTIVQMIIDWTEITDCKLLPIEILKEWMKEVEDYEKTMIKNIYNDGKREGIARAHGDKDGDYWVTAEEYYRRKYKRY